MGSLEWSARREKVDYRHYRARRLIGKGTYGEVILCERKEDAPGAQMKGDLLVALKRVKRAQSEDLEEKIRERSIRNEARILRSVRHPFIVESLFAVKRADFIYLGLEYCPGGDLFTIFCHDLPLSKLEASKYLLEITLALEYLRERRIIHRDIKPENVVLKDGSCKLVDFGNAHVLKDDNDTVITRSGTMPYTAPEILEREPHQYEVDWWSLGVLACEMLTYISPFGNSDVLETADMCAAICTEPPMISKDVDEDTRDFLQRLLIKEQSSRLGYKSPEEVKHHPFFPESLIKEVTMKHLAGQTSTDSI